MTNVEGRECIHHWFIDSGKTARLPREVASRHPNCVGRSSHCKKCGITKIQPERVWDTTWSQ